MTLKTFDGDLNTNITEAAETHDQNRGPWPPVASVHSKKKGRLSVAR